MRELWKTHFFAVSICDSGGLVISSNYSNSDGYKFPQIFGVGNIDFYLDKIPFKPSKYVCSITLSEEKVGVSKVLEWHEKCYIFTVVGGSTNYALINPFPKWSLKYYEENESKCKGK